MSKKRHKKKHDKPPKVEYIWVEGHKLNEKTGELEPVRYKLKPKNGCRW